MTFAAGQALMMALIRCNIVCVDQIITPNWTTEHVHCQPIASSGYRAIRSTKLRSAYQNRASAGRELESCFGSPAARSTTPPTTSTASSATSASPTARSSPTCEGGRTIDATGMVVFPGGVDVHTHVAGAALNFARGHDPREAPQARADLPHAATPRRHRRAPRRPPSPPATSTPAWATPPSNEAAVPILSAKHTHEELRDTPIVDKSCCVLMANNEIMLDLLENGELRAGQARRRLADLGGEGLRRQGGQPRRRRGAGSGARTPRGCHEPVPGYKQGHARARSSRPWRGSSTSWGCRTRCTCTATTSARRATSPPRSRR